MKVTDRSRLEWTNGYTAGSIPLTAGYTVVVPCMQGGGQPAWWQSTGDSIPTTDGACVAVMETHCVLGEGRVKAQKIKAQQPIEADRDTAKRTRRNPKQESKSCEIQMLDRSPHPFTIKKESQKKSPSP